jgi:glycosyltransferase involved in cell wall biosynthesis
MLASANPIVSFIVPTLNRGRYVLRAVESCLRAGAEAGVAVEVIVLDSESDDGSWEALNERFKSCEEVRLAQNKRGLGPTRSWLDGARLVRGRFVTFLWSDDYVAPHFLRSLLPPLADGAELAIGFGAVRDIDDDSSLAPLARCDLVSREQIAAEYFGVAHSEAEPLPVSPAAALFTREAFIRWLELVEPYCQADELRSVVMWRRAIGPDLLLFLAALDLNTGPVPLVRGYVAQFSAHASSITVSSSSWPLRTGYWLARAWLVERWAEDRTVSDSGLATISVRMFLQALVLAASAPPRLADTSRALIQRCILSQAKRIWSRARHRVGTRGMLRVSFRAAARRPAGTRPPGAA